MLMIGAHRLARDAAAVPISASPEPDLDQARHQFTAVAASEAAAIFLAAATLVWSGHGQWIGATVCTVVGFHFVPLARLFRLDLYQATAAGLCMVAATTTVLGLAGAASATWRLLPGLGAAITLWATGDALLATSRR